MFWKRKTSASTDTDAFRRNLEALRSKQQQRNPTDPPLPAPRDESKAKTPGEVLPPDATGGPQGYINRAQTEAPVDLARSLESILQGQKVSSDIFTALYRGGYVFKEPGGKWGITALGKQLVENQKIVLEAGECMIDELPCRVGWKSQGS